MNQQNDLDIPTLQMLQSQYHKPLEEAAAHLKVSKTKFKKICRERGIKRWPHRQIRSINQNIDILKQRATEVRSQIEVDTANTAIEKLEMKKSLVTIASSWDIEPWLRNYIFNLDMEFFEESNFSLILNAIQRQHDNTNETDETRSLYADSNNYGMDISHNTQLASFQSRHATPFDLLEDSRFHETESFLGVGTSAYQHTLDHNLMASVRHNAQILVQNIEVPPDNRHQAMNKNSFSHFVNRVDPKRCKYSGNAIVPRIGLSILSVDELAQYNEHRI